MEFLLVSRRKNSTWIRLKELLCWPCEWRSWPRRSGVAAAFAEPMGSTVRRGQDASDRALGRQLLDVGSLGRIPTPLTKLAGSSAGWPTQAARQSTPQTFTLLRYSRAPNGQRPADSTCSRNVSNQFRTGTRGAVAAHATIARSDRRRPGPDGLEEMLPELTGEDVVVHIVSDFRVRDWQDPGLAAESLKRVSQAAEKLYLINCMDAARPNLAIAARRSTAWHARRRGARVAGSHGAEFRQRTGRERGGHARRGRSRTSGARRSTRSAQGSRKRGDFEVFFPRRARIR